MSNSEREKLIDCPLDLRDAIKRGLEEFKTIDDIVVNVQAYLTMAFLNQCTKAGSDSKVEAALKETFKVIMRKRSI